MLAVTLSSCDGNDKEVTQLREKNRQLGDGINQILKTQSEKKSALEKSLEGIHIQLGKVGAEKEKLDGDLNKVESEAAKTLIRQSLGKTTTQKEKLEKEKACLHYGFEVGTGESVFFGSAYNACKSFCRSFML